MSINGIGSGNSAIYQSLLKALQANSGDSTSNQNAIFGLNGSTGAGSAADPSSGQQDAQTLLARLAMSQPSLIDFLSGGGTNDSMNSEDALNFDPESAELNALLGGNSDPSADTQAAQAEDPLLSVMNQFPSNLGQADLGTLLDRLYSQSDTNNEANQAAGQAINIRK